MIYRNPCWIAYCMIRNDSPSLGLSGFRWQTELPRSVRYEMFANKNVGNIRIIVSGNLIVFLILFRKHPVSGVAGSQNKFCT